MLKLVNKYIVILIGFYVFWLGLLPQFISNAIGIVCRNLSHNSSYNIEVINPRVRLDVLPVVRVYADKISVKSKNDAFNAWAEDFKIKFRILPLLSGRLHVNSIRSDVIYLNADLKNEVELDKDFFNKLGDTKVVFDTIRVRDFETSLNQKGTKEPIIYTGKDFVFRNKNRYVEFRVKSNLKINDKTSDAYANLWLPKNNNIDKTVFDIEVKNLDISPFGVYFRHYLPKDLTALKGMVNIDADKDNLVTEFRNCSAVMKDSARSVIFPESLTVKSQYKIKQHSIKLENTEIESNNIHANIDGKISDYWGRSMPRLDLNIRVNDSRVEDFVNLLPPFTVEEFDAYKLKKYKFYGDALANITIKGKLPEPDITGNIFVDNGILTKPIPNTLSGASIKIALNGKSVNFDVNVPAGGVEKVYVKGVQELYNMKYADLTVQSTQRVPLSSAEEVVNPLHEILNFVVGPLPILDVSGGTGNIDITVKGNRKNPHVWGGLNFNNAVVKFREMPDLVLNDADAVLAFNDQSASFTTKNGLVNGKDFNIDGVCDLSGKFDFAVSSINQPSAEMYKALKGGVLISEIGKILPDIERIEGLLDLNLKIFGNVKYIEDLQFNKNAFAKGEITIKDNRCAIQQIDVDNANGKINIEADGADVDITASVTNTPMDLKAKAKGNLVDLVLNIPRLNPNFLLGKTVLKDRQYLPFVSVFLKYRGDINNIEYDRVNFKAHVLEPNLQSIVKVTSGDISLSNNKLILSNMKGYIGDKNNPFSSELRISDAFSKVPTADGHVYVKAPDISILNEIIHSELLSKEVTDFAKDYEFKGGAVNLNLRINNGKVNADSDVSNIALEYLPLELPVKVINGNITIRNNALKLNKINVLADKMPVIVDGEIKDIFGRRIFDLYMNTKPQQEFIDKYINKNRIYPVKIKGDLVYWAKLRGTADNFDVKTQFDLSRDSYFYYLGATIGDIENAISLYIDAKITGKIIKLREFAYDKIIDSLSGKQTRFNLLKASGGVEILKDDLLFRDLHIKTSQPTDARVFNIIFRKPNIKQGQFTSDLRINNKLSSPRVIGEFKIYETNIPFIDVTVKNVELAFKDRFIDIVSKGEVMGNDVRFEGVLRNKLTIPYHIERAQLYTKDFDFNRVVTKLKTAQMEPQGDITDKEDIDLRLFTADKFNIKADSVELRNIKASDFEAEFSLNNRGLLDVYRFGFDIAQGKLSGRYKYNLNNNDASILLDADSINANDMAIALFDLKNQIYGDLTGSVNLSCNGKDFRSCMATLGGNTTFNVKDGKMPKLGSLEYLLRAGNLVKGGITGLSINSIIDLVKPLRTGEFSDIFGNITIADGLANDIEITTTGKNLSLFISGTYNFATENAEMEVLGLLSRKISTMFGPVGNLSINTLFNIIPGVDLSKDSEILNNINKIPGVELSSKAYRKFVAEIKGDINGDNYVTSFSWIN